MVLVVTVGHPPQFAAAELVIGRASLLDHVAAADPFDPRAARCGPLDSSPSGSGPTDSGPTDPGSPFELWQHPVEAAVLDGFRPPSNPYGSGNRGLEYGTEPGDNVWAASPGTVAFAGPVGGKLFVVVVHPSGLRVTYSYLERIDVAVGAMVDTGQQLALAGTGMHLTVRDAGAYIDPLPFMADYRCFFVRLVPLPRAG